MEGDVLRNAPLSGFCDSPRIRIEARGRLKRAVSVDGDDGDVVEDRVEDDRLLKLPIFFGCNVLWSLLMS